MSKNELAGKSLAGMLDGDIEVEGDDRVRLVIVMLGPGKTTGTVILNSPSEGRKSSFGTRI
jgi:hypothetical protein